VHLLGLVVLALPIEHPSKVTHAHQRVWVLICPGDDWDAISTELVQYL
jgi:hypothetical protein